MDQKHAIIKGAFILTLTGFATRFIGFFYRIFLSQSFGEESVGLYQLIFPVYALCFSLCCAGIETAVARNVAASSSLGDKKRAVIFLYCGLFLSFLPSCIMMLLMQKEADFIASFFLGDPRCAPLLIIISYAMPFAAVHSGICGYYIGLKKTKIPAISQLIEQIARVCSVFFLYQYFMERSLSAGISLAAVGLVMGEIFSSLFSLHAFRKEKRQTLLPASAVLPQKPGSWRNGMRGILQTSLPLTGNRVLLNILQSTEAVSIPAKLQIFGFSVSDSLSIYGVLTGMALPCILFPSAITNSISTMLLPAVAEIQAGGSTKKLREVIRKVFFCCFALGLACCFAFLLFGQLAGELLFHSQMAGQFIITLAWICPFLYTNSTLLSVINGLGKANISFLLNTAGLLLRIASVFFMIPLSGIRGYLWGLLISQGTVFLLCLMYLGLYIASICKKENRGVK